MSWASWDEIDDERLIGGGGLEAAAAAEAAAMEAADVATIPLVLALWEEILLLKMVPLLGLLVAIPTRDGEENFLHYVFRVKS